MSNLQSLLERKLIPMGSSGDEVIYLCPNCEDKSGHLYANFDKGLFHCVRCNYSGKLPKLIRRIGIDISYDYEKLYSEHESDLDKVINQNRKPCITSEVLEYSTDLQVLTSYYNMHVKPLSDEAIQYLINRGFTYDTISRLRIMEGLNRYGERFALQDTKGKCVVHDGRDYSGRIMVPSLRRDGTISFYVGRDYTGTKPNKYVNPPKTLVAASEDIWNLDMIESDSVIICEGVFTAISASPQKLNSCATYGKSIAYKSSDVSGVRVTSQGEKLLNKRFKNYYICYDADAHNEAISSCKYLYERGANVYLVLIDPVKYGKHADIADIGYKEFLNLLSDAIHYKGDLSLFT